MSDQYLGIETGEADFAINRMTTFDGEILAAKDRANAALQSVGMEGELGTVVQAFEKIRTPNEQARIRLTSTLVGMEAATTGMSFEQIAAFQQQVVNCVWPGLGVLRALLKQKQSAYTIAEILDIIDKGDDLAMTNGELNEVRSGIEALSEAEREQLFSQMTDEQLDRLFHNVHSSGWLSNDWNDDERAEFYDLLATVPKPVRDSILSRLPPETQTNADIWFDYADANEEATNAAAANGSTAALDDLKNRGNLDGLPPVKRITIFSQAANYPNPTSIGNLERLAGKEWARDQSLEDFQRSAKSVGYMSEHSLNSTNPDQRMILDNTLDSFLAEDAPYQMVWKDLTDPSKPNSTMFGTADGDTLTLNSVLISADNGPMITAGMPQTDIDDVNHLVLHTVAHEVNHLVTGHTDSGTYDRFMDEYRAWYVGFVAEKGRPPTNKEIQRRVDWMITEPGNSYGHLYDAVDKVGEDGQLDEGDHIAKFVNQLYDDPNVTGDELDPSNVREAVDGNHYRQQQMPGGPILVKVELVDPNGTAPAPVSVDGGPNNLDNSWRSP